MAHHSIVPRREPCFNCNNPVFFAERLVINSILYHRSCFRCARCHSTLTLGNFYETETENEFCCETCPDEEKSDDEGDDDLDSISDLKGEGASSANEKCDDEFEELYRQTQEVDDEIVKCADDDNNSSERLEKSGSNNSVEHASELLPEKLLKVHLNEETIKDDEIEISVPSTAGNSEVEVNKAVEIRISPPCDSAVKNEEDEIELSSASPPEVENEKTSEHSENVSAIVQQNELIETSSLLAAAQDELPQQLSNNDECAAAAIDVVVDNDRPQVNIEFNESENNDTQPPQHEHEQQQHDVINISESDTRKKPIPKPRSLNPFGEFDDDDDEEETVSNAGSQKQYKKELNPFGSDDDEDNMPAQKQIPKVPAAGRVNPFNTSSTSSPSESRKSHESPTSKFSTTKRRAPKPPTLRAAEVFSQAPVEVIDMKTREKQICVAYAKCFELMKKIIHVDVYCRNLRISTRQERNGQLQHHQHPLERSTNLRRLCQSKI